MNGDNRKYSNSLSFILLMYIVLFTVLIFVFLGMSSLNGFSGNERMIFGAIIALAAIILIVFFRIKVYEPLKKIEDAMNVLEKGNTAFNIEFKEKRDVYPLSLQLNSMLKKLKDSMDREYTAGILKKQAEINALQSQINPHFLYNVLDSIRGHALVEGVDEIAEMTEALSKLFRYSINSNKSLVTLDSELKNIKDYFKIQQYRFNNKFDLSIVTEEEAENILSCLMPKLTIQPILENSIYHGLEMKMDKGHITIRIELTKNRLIIHIIDDGAGMDNYQLERVNENLNNQNEVRPNSEQSNKTGIALSNVNSRIKMQFGEEYGLHIYSTLGIGTDVEVVLPVIREEQS